MTPDAYIFVILLFSMTYVFLAAFFQHKKWNYIHETTVSLLIGALFGVFLYFFTDVFSAAFGTQLKQVVFLVLLPLMLFEDGYNIKKRKFFQNIMYINLYGIIGTFIQFGVFFGVIYAFNANGLFLSQSTGKAIILMNWQVLVFSTLLCSIDTVVPQKIVNPQRYPKLFSIIFGQSIMKDTFTITLFDAIINVYNSTPNHQIVDLVGQDAGWIILTFFIVICGSIAIGIIGALITTFLFKQFRFLVTGNGIAQVSLVIITGYITYISSEWATLSGVISMLFCGITLSHFNIYNLSQYGKVSTKTCISVLALIAQGLLFFLIGAFMFNVQYDASDDGTKQMQNGFSYTMVAVAFACILIGRAVNVFLMSLIGNLIAGKNKWRLNFYEYIILYFSGLVKGAVPFALILSIPGANTSQQGCSIVVTITIVVFTTSFLLNSILPKILRTLLIKINKMYKEDPDHPSLTDSLLQPKMISPQQIAQKLKYSSKLKGTTQKYWRRCQEACLKPILIYDYHSRKDQIKLDKLKVRNQQYEAYKNRFNGQQNILDPNSQHNEFIELRIEESSDSSDEQKIQTKTQRVQTQALNQRNSISSSKEQEIQDFKYSQTKIIDRNIQQQVKSGDQKQQ